MAAPTPEPPALPALHASHAGLWLASPEGPAQEVGKGQAINACADTPVLMLNAPLVAARLGYPDLSGLDLLELYAFLHPAKFCVPTPKGLAAALDIEPPEDDAATPLFLRAALAALLAVCARDDWEERHGAWSTLQSLARAR